MLATAGSKAFFNKLLEELAIHQDTIASEQVEAFITAIFDVADLLSDETRRMLEVPVHWRIAFLVQKAIEKLGATDNHLEVFTSALSKTKGLFMAVEFVALVEVPPETDAQAPMFSANELVEARRAAVRKIEGAASSGALARHPKLAILLSLWRRWGNNEDVSTYITALTKTNVGTLQLLRSLVGRSLRQGTGDYIATERYYMRRNDIETLISMDTLDGVVQELPASIFSDEDRRAVRAFQEAMERRRAGKSDDDRFTED